MYLLTKASAKTAVHRREHSFPARTVALANDSFYGGTSALNTPRRILDFGAGHGKDVAWFGALGYDAHGYDPFYEKFKSMPAGLFDAVFCTYVLCTLPTIKERVAVLTQAWKKVRVGGKLVVSVRTDTEIRRRAKNWRKIGDGYKTPKGTFQHGFSELELLRLIKNSGILGDNIQVLNRSRALIVTVQKGA